MIGENIGIGPDIMCAAMNASLGEKYIVQKIECDNEGKAIRITPRNKRHGSIIITIFEKEGEIVIKQEKATKNGIGMKYAQKIKENCHYPILPFHTIEVC